MKKFNILITLVVLSLFVVSCESYDDFDADRKTVVGFTVAEKNINNIPEGGERSSTLDLFVSDISAEDRDFRIVVIPTILTDPEIQTETNPENYSFDEFVTIPANTNRGEITVTGIDISIEDPEGEYFSLAVEGGGNTVSGGRVTIRLRQ